MTKYEALYKEFLEALLSNESPERRFNTIQFMMFKSFYNTFHKIDNPRDLKISPNDYSMKVMLNEYIEKLNNEPHERYRNKDNNQSVLDAIMG